MSINPSWMRCYVFAHHGYAQGGAHDCLGSHALPSAARNHVERIDPAWAQVVRFRGGVAEVLGEWEMGRWVTWEAGEAT